MEEKRLVSASRGGAVQNLDVSPCAVHMVSTVNEQPQIQIQNLDKVCNERVSSALQ